MMGQPNGDPAAGDGGDGNTGGEGDKGNEFKAVTFSTQEELDAAFAERATRAQEAGKNAVLKPFLEAGVSLEDALAAATAAKAEEEAKKSPAVKEREAREKAEAELAKYKNKEVRAGIAAEVAKTITVGNQPIPASLLAGDTKEEIEAHAKALVDFYNSVAGPRAPGYNPEQGHSNGDKTASGDPLRDWMATGSFV